MMFGDQADEDTSARIVSRARDIGVNFIDTADAYAAEKSEEIVGRAIRGDRDRWVVATNDRAVFLAQQFRGKGV
jgi:aryl-alcohol dehydrogenase (NADP+)